MLNNIAEGIRVAKEWGVAIMDTIRVIVLVLAVVAMTIAATVIMVLLINPVGDFMKKNSFLDVLRMPISDVLLGLFYMIVAGAIIFGLLWPMIYRCWHWLRKAE